MVQGLSVSKRLLLSRDITQHSSACHEYMTPTTIANTTRAAEMAFGWLQWPGDRCYDMAIRGIVTYGSPIENQVWAIHPDKSIGQRECNYYWRLFQSKLSD